jgi:sensor histidine kinase YesM
MKAKLLLVLIFISLIWNLGKAQYVPDILPREWLTMKYEKNGDTIFYAVRSNVFPNSTNRVIIFSRPKKEIKVVFKDGIINHSRDSLYDLIPSVLGEYKLIINGITITGRTQALPPPFFCLKGFPYIESKGVKSYMLKGITVSDLKKYNVIEARVADRVLRVKEFQCSVYNVKEQSKIISRVFKSGRIDPSFLDSLQIDHNPKMLMLENVTYVELDSTLRFEKRPIERESLIVTIYKDSTDLLIGRYLSGSPSQDKRVNSDIRLKIEGRPDSLDLKTVDEIVRELNSLLGTIKVKLVKHFPSIVINFDSIDTKHGTGVVTGMYSNSGKNPLFPKLSTTRYFINIDLNERKARDLFLWKTISRSLGEFDNYGGPQFFESTIIGGSTNPGLTKEDKMVLKALYSRGIVKTIDQIFDVPPRIPKIPVMLTILVTLILSFFIYEINNYFNLTGFIKNQGLEYVISALMIAQIAILFYTVFVKDVYNSPPVPYSILPLEIYGNLFAVAAGLSSYISDSYSERIKIKWLKLIVNPILSMISLYIAYQVVYFFVRGEGLRIITVSSQVLVVGYIIIAFRFYLLYKTVRLTSIMQEKEFELTKQKELKNRAELNALQARINPHFLYNALNSIAALAHIDSSRTEEMALSLSKLFRYSLNREENILSTLRQEIEMVQLYLQIEKQRFGDRVSFEVTISEDLNERSVPRFLIQPLVENAIKHGVSQITGKGIVKLRVYKEHTSLLIEIYDNGPNFKKGLVIGYGLQNTYDKLTLIYKKPYEVRFVNEPEKYIQIKL